MSEELRAAARRIFRKTLQTVDVRDAVRQQVSADETTLRLGTKTLPRAEVDSVIVIAVGKAAVPMFEAAAEKLRGMPLRAIVVGPRETLPADGPAHFLVGEHPTPGEGARLAADNILTLLRAATSQDAVLFLVSGGASAMVEKPLDDVISLADVAGFHRALVGSGLAITQMNALRKHLSAVKGGRMAVAAAVARWQCTLLVSDVPATAPDAIASGPSLPDSTTVEDCLTLFPQLQLASGSTLPQSVVNFFSSGHLPETPKEGDAVFTRSSFQVILSGDHLAQAAAEAAAAEGFFAFVDNTCDDWEYRDAARYLLDRGAALARVQERICLISVGEVAVAIGGDAGEGGRNGQFALWCARELRQHPPATVLSAGSDGIDGQSSAAGAVCDETTVVRAATIGESVDEALFRFHTAPLLRAVGDALETGPTGNNLRDLRLILMERPGR
jgi:hydroxypyruvate reductase